MIKLSESEWGKCLLSSSTLHGGGETDFLSELFLSQSKNVNGTELESF